MKKYWLQILTLSASSLIANDATFIDSARFQILNFKEDFGSCEAPRPYGILATADAMGKAELSTDSSQNLRYGEAEADLLYGFKVDPLSGFSFEAGYGSDFVDWNANPYFNQKSFNYVNLAVLGYTGSIDRWFWQTGLGVHINNDHGEGFINYSRWGAFFWGRYAVSDCFGLNVGTLTLTGMRKTITYPLVGIDWRISPDWKLDAIFPVQMELSYYLTQRWTVSAYLRPFLTRQRLSPSEPLSEGIFEYRNVGAELDISYQYAGLDFTLFGGYTFSGILKVMDASGFNPSYFNFDTVPYLGVNVLWAF